MCETVIIPEKYLNSSCPGYYEEVNVETWNQAKEVLKLFSKDWIFRGQKDSNWPLVPSIERPTLFASPDDLDRIIIDALKNEMEKKNGYPKTNLGWLAFAQHHGGLTRLLDFTTDPFIACFFAFGLHQDAINLPHKCAVWVVNRTWCNIRTCEKLKKLKKSQNINQNDLNTPELFDKAFIFSDEFDLCVYAVISDWQNQRMIQQKSVFLCKCDPVDTFESNLIENGYAETKNYIKKIIIPTQLREDALNDLNGMGISNQSILPGEEHFREMSEIVKRFEEHARESIKQIKNKDK